MFLQDLPRLLDRINNASIEQYPFEHLLIDKFLPDDLYQDLLTHYIDISYLQTLGEMNRVGRFAYNDRKVICLESNLPILPEPQRSLWETVNNTFNELSLAILNKFTQGEISSESVKAETLYVIDQKGYKLGPHTDSPKKICTSLFYLADGISKMPGTTLYKPKDNTFTCQGGPHYNYDLFDPVVSFDYVPNRLVSFLKSDHSFHGVEPVTIDGQRNLLICDVQKS